MPTLQYYLNQVQWLLHDTAGNFWSVAELTTYINEARNEIATDTNNNRVMTVVDLVAGTETYPLPAGAMDVDGIYVAVTTPSIVSIPLLYADFFTINRDYRYNAAQGVPQAFCRYNDSVYIEPIPNASYVATFDCVMAVTNLVNTTDVEANLNLPYTEIIKYFAAYRALMKQSDFPQANEFLNLYTKFINQYLENENRKRHMPLPAQTSPSPQKRGA